jgi:hypothetical protein
VSALELAVIAAVVVYLAWRLRHVLRKASR